MKNLPANYEVVEEIGKGAFGMALKIRDRATKMLYCAKLIDLKRSTQEQKESALREVIVGRRRSRSSRRWTASTW